MTTKIKLQLGAILVLAVFALGLILSQTASPDNPVLWGLKRIQEKVFLKLKPNPQEKLEYTRSLLDRRLDELSNVVKNKNYGYVLNSSLRYSTLAGQITELIISNNLREFVDPIKQQFLNHQKVLDQVYIIYPKNIPGDEEWKYIQDDINYLKIYLDKLSEVK